jgi:hypothetical protein
VTLVAVFFLGAGACGRAWFETSGAPGDASLSCVSLVSLSLIADDFNDGVLDPGWVVQTQGDGLVAETGGALTLSSPSGQAGASATYQSGDCLDLVGAAAFIEILDGTSLAAANFTFELYDTADRYVRFSKSGAQVSFEWPGGSGLASWNPGWWRMSRESGGVVHADLSTDGLTWTTIVNASSSNLPSQGTLRLAATTGQAGTPWTVRFDNLNVVP